MRNCWKLQIDSDDKPGKIAGVNCDTPEKQERKRERLWAKKCTFLKKMNGKICEVRQREESHVVAEEKNDEDARASEKEITVNMAVEVKRIGMRIRRSCGSWRLRCRCCWRR